MLAAARPGIGDLIAIDQKDRQGKLHIIDFIVTHSESKVDDFAHLLLKDHNVVRGLHHDNKDKREFVRAVLKKWVSTDGRPAVPRTWESLIEVMKDADLDEVTVIDIENNLPTTDGTP